MTIRVVGLWVSLITVTGMLPMRLAASHAPFVQPDEMRAERRWTSAHIEGARPSLPFSFTYGGRPSSAVMDGSKLIRSVAKLDSDRRQITLNWRDPQTGLEARCVAVEYSDYPAVEWTVRLRNGGRLNTPILEDVQGLNVRFLRGPIGEFVLHGIKGDWCDAHSYEPYTFTMDPNATRQFAPPDSSGKSCDGPNGWPYFNLQIPGGGVMIAVGWPGQWAASFARDADRTIHVQAGQQRTHLFLKPGEEIRTPLIAMVFWKGDDVARAQNLWRRWYLAHVLPRVDGVPQPPVTQIQVGGDEASIADVLAYLQAGVKPDICWRDAGGSYTWYPNRTGPYHGEDSWLNTGTWDVDPVRYPHGFKPFSDAVRKRSISFLLWFEPERVGDPDSWLGRNHPEWLLPGESHGSLLDEGNPEARKWLIDHIDAMVHTQGLDWYREDMNGGGPLPAWRKHDANDRQGITENLYVQGHLAFWDELRRRNPKLRIDSCASGGRRNDLETMRRAVPLLRSDFQFPGMKGFVEGNQGHTFGISSWLPWYGSGVYGVDPYTVRSFLMPGFGVVPSGDIKASAELRTVVKRAYDEDRVVAPLMLGDYYPLTPYSLESNRWIGWQFNRPERDDGVVQAFRRADCAESALTLCLHGLDPQATYILTGFDGAEPARATGAALMSAGLQIAVKTKPAAAVVIYRKAP